MSFNARRTSTCETEAKSAVLYSGRGVPGMERREFWARNARLDKHGRAERLFQAQEDTGSQLKQVTKRKRC